MLFQSEQVFSHPVADIVDAYADPNLYEALPDLPNIGRPQVLDHRREANKAFLDIRYAFMGELPAPALAIIDPAQLTWVQRTTIDVRAGVASIVLEPDHYPDRLRCSGTFQFSTHEAADCRRRVEGDLEVKVILVSGQVERALVLGLQEYLAAEADAVDRWLDRSV